jgi:membrane-associated phospholipid phosphatase
VTIVTANHYWVDAALGWMVALTAAVVAHRLALARPEAWAFRPAAPQEAEA